MLVRRGGGENGELRWRPGKMMSNSVSWAKKKPSSTPKQGTIYKLQLLFESGYYLRVVILKCWLEGEGDKMGNFLESGRENDVKSSVMGKRETVIHGQTR